MANPTSNSPSNHINPSIISSPSITRTELLVQFSSHTHAHAPGGDFRCVNEFWWRTRNCFISCVCSSGICYNYCRSIKSLRVGESIPLLIPPLVVTYYWIMTTMCLLLFVCCFLCAVMQVHIELLDLLKYAMSVGCQSCWKFQHIDNIFDLSDICVSCIYFLCIFFEYYFSYLKTLTCEV